MFRLNEKIVYPGHGVAFIHQIIQKKVGTSFVSFYELKFFHKDMTVLIPTDNAESAGIRPLSSTTTIDEALSVFGEPAKKLHYYEFTASNWNKRNKEYQAKLRTGRLKDLSEVYRDLCHIATQKELSFGEKNLLHQTELLLVEEIAIVQQVEEQQAVENLRLLSTATRQGVVVQ